MGRTRDFEQAQSAARLQHAVELGERCRQVADVAQRVAHAQHVEVGVGQGHFLGTPFDQTNTVGQVGIGHHAGTRVDADDQGRIADQFGCLARDQAGADADIDDAHAGAESRPHQGLASIPGPGAERQQALDPIVVASGVVENVAHESPAFLLARVIGGERQVRRMNDSVVRRSAHLV